GARAWSRCLTIDLAVYEGSCLALASNFRASTRDVDAVALCNQAIVDQLAAEVATTLGLPSSWLIDGVRTYLSSRTDVQAQHELFCNVSRRNGARSPGFRAERRLHARHEAHGA